MPWKFFRSKQSSAQPKRAPPPKEPSQPSEPSFKQQSSSTQLHTSYRKHKFLSPTSAPGPSAQLASQKAKSRVLSSAAPPLELWPRHTVQRPKLDPESAPLSEFHSYLGDLPQQSRVLTPVGSQHSTEKLSKRRSNHSLRSMATARSVHSAKSFNSHASTHSHRSANSGRSSKAGQLSLRSKHIKAARAAKHASSAYIAASRGSPLFCYTCGSEFVTVQCQVCRTCYLPPQFKFRVSGEIISGFAPTYEETDYNIPFLSKPNSSNLHEVSQIHRHASSSGKSSSSESKGAGVGSGDAISFWGIFPEEENTSGPNGPVDLEFLSDLADHNEAGLLEMVLFDCFCNVEIIFNTFCLSGEDPTHGGIVDNEMVSRLYHILSSVSSTGPIRGILHAAQTVLLTRKHEAINERELIYICVILQCPAIADCSMFTKLTGPMQKLSKYTSLRSRARTILEICAGLVVHSPENLHLEFSRVFIDTNISTMRTIVDLCNAYVSHRLSFDFHNKSESPSHPSKFKLIKHEWYSSDWRIRVVVKLMSFFWASNTMRLDQANKLPISSFYNTMVDLVSIGEDFDSWQSSHSQKKPRFTFCRYPFLMSVGSKARVFEHAIQREVNVSIQQELFAVMAQSFSSHDLQNRQFELRKYRTFKLQIRRNYLLEDSIRQLKSWPSSRRRELKIEFAGEPGIDAGGLKKEWFLLFYQKLFDPALNVFKMDEISNYCWFSKNANLEYCTAAGTVLGLAIFNSITIDFNLPLLLFKLLLDAPYDLNDICILWPELGQSFHNILDYEDDDFEEVFGLTFSAPDGTPLIAGGEELNVTLASKDTYVSLMVDFFVDPQSEPFKRFKSSFLSVCGCNAITLFQPEELELLVRGDRQPIDIPVLRSVTKYVNFGHRYERANQEQVVQWFWDYFDKLDPALQARLLQFVTSTDRAPAAGMVQMRFSIMCLGGDSERLPIAHTCFNQLCIYRYKNRAKLEKKLSLAIAEYQGFGLK